MTVLTCDDVRDRAGAFVLGALPDDEAAAVREHLATCDDAHAEIAELGGVVPYLAESLEPMEPPAELRARIMAAAAADLEQRRTSLSAVAVPVGAAADIPAAAIPAAEPAMPSAAAAPVQAPVVQAPVVPAPVVQPPVGERARPSWWPFGLAATAGLAAAAALAVAIIGSLATGLIRPAGDEYSTALRSVLDAASEPGSQIAVLASDAPDGPRGLAAVQADGTVVMAMSGLDATSGSEVYAAWMIASAESDPVPIGEFQVGSDGVGYLPDGAGPAAAGVVLAVTREPQPSATTPTLPILASGGARPAPEQPA
jgi:anti-sigma factor RsiW